MSAYSNLIHSLTVDEARSPNALAVTTVQEFSGYPAIVSTYEYARGTTRKRGRQMIVYTDTHEITITQSTPVERGNEGVARMDWIRDSIRIQ